MNARRRVVELLLAGCTEYSCIAKALRVTESAVKHEFKSIYWHLGIVSGIKKVKLAVMLAQQPLLIEGLDTKLPETPFERQARINYLRRKKK